MPLKFLTRGLGLARHARLPVFAALLLSLNVSSCLPDRLSDGEIDDKIKATEQCGNGKIDEDKGESCDDGNKNYCDGCEACGARRVLDVKGKGDTLVMHTAALGGLKVAKADQFSVELWFKLKGALLEGKRVGLVVRGAEGSGRFFALALIGAAGSNGVHPVCGLSVADGKPTDATTALVVPTDYVLKVGEWHHLICGYDGARNVVGLAADLNALKEVPAKVAAGSEVAGSIFAEKDFVAMGVLNDVTDLSDVPFDGLMDEVRWATRYPAKQPVFKRRYADDEANTAFLLHLDGADATAPNQVKSADGKVTAATVLSTHTLSFAKDNCYGADAAALLCEFSDTPAAWCEDAPK